MKIVCDSCSTKYSISDEKVRGKVFKIRCKKCSHIIVVKGTAGPAGGPSAEPVPETATWHLVVDGDQVGPLGDADVRARLARGEITVENYVWREGFADWLRLADVPDFSDVTAGAPLGTDVFPDSGRESHPTEINQHSGGNSSRNSGGNSGGNSSGNSSALFASGGSGLAADEVTAPPPSTGYAAPAPAVAPASAAAPTPTAADDAFAAPPGRPFTAEGSGGDLFGSALPAAALGDSARLRSRGTNGTGPARHDGGRVETLTAQRSENSVLFSLSNLQSLAAPAPAAKPGAMQTTEGSGLIDIRAMAASTLKAPANAAVSFGGASGRTADDDLPTFGAFSSAAPVLLPLPSSSGPPKWVYVLAGLAVVLIIAVGVATYSILNRPVVVPQPVAPAAQPAAPPATQAGAREAPGKTAQTGKTSDERPVAASNTIAAADLPPRETGDPAAIAGGGAKAGKHGKPGHRGPAGAPEAKAPGGNVVAAAEPAEPEKAKPAKGSLDDLLEGALNGRRSRPRVDDDATAARKPAGGGEAAGGGGPLAKGAVVAGMNGIKGRISACYAQYKVPGLAMVNVVIGKTGKVTSATVIGKFAGTPSGACVEGAVRSAAFPPSDGLTTPYPFSLR